MLSEEQISANQTNISTEAGLKPATYCIIGGPLPATPEVVKLIIIFFKNKYCNFFFRFIPLVKYSSTTAQSTFTGKKDIFDGITVDSSKETCSHAAFPSKLEGTLHLGVRLIYILISKVNKRGFCQAAVLYCVVVAT